MSTQQIWTANQMLILKMKNLDRSMDKGEFYSRYKKALKDHFKGWTFLMILNC